MSLAVTVDAERDQVVELIVAELTLLGEVMHLQGRANRGCRRRDRMAHFSEIDRCLGAHLDLGDLCRNVRTTKDASSLKARGSSCNKAATSYKRKLNRPQANSGTADEQSVRGSSSVVARVRETLSKRSISWGISSSWQGCGTDTSNITREP